MNVFKKDADLAISQLGPLSGLDFGMNRDSVEWVDGFIERQRSRDDFDPSQSSRLIGVLGSFLGECLIAAAGGEWRHSDAGWSVTFPNNAKAFPFAKVEKQFANGRQAGDSILGFYDVAVRVVATGRLSTLQTKTST